jgi:hypothetical protein
LLLINRNKTEFAEICLKARMTGKTNKAPGGTMGGSKSRIKIGIFVASVLAMGIFIGATCGGAETPDLGNNASLHGKGIFPANNPWNQRIDTAPVDPNSNAIISRFSGAGIHPDFGANWGGGPFGIPYVVVAGTQNKVNISPISFADESDSAPYPIPANAPIEGGSQSTGDRHVIVLDRDNWILYELYNAYPNGDGSWRADSAAIFDLNSNHLRPDGWTSADAAGLPILPGLVRYDEVYEQKAIHHAIRFTLQKTRKAYVHPATHFASSLTDQSYPPMGARFRLRADFNISGFSPANQVILQAMKTYGLILADNGSNLYISGAPDSRWDDGDLNALKSISAVHFEMIQLGYASEPSAPADTQAPAPPENLRIL